MPKKAKYKFIQKRVEDKQGTITERSLRVEILNYLQFEHSEEEEDKSQLNAFPVVRKLFRKYNVIRSSSGQVERDFSFAKMVLRPQRQRLSDDMFEKLLVLKRRNIYEYEI